MISTPKQKIPTANLLEVVKSLAGTRYFSATDLAHGYYRVWTVESDKEKTAFRVPSELYEYKRMPFQLKRAAATFCRMMASVFCHTTPLQLVLYMDDLCAISVTLDEHLKDWRIS